MIVLSRSNAEPFALDSCAGFVTAKAHAIDAPGAWSPDITLMRLNIEPRAMESNPRKPLPPTPPMKPSRTTSPSLGSLTSQERGQGPRAPHASEYRKHSLEDILQPAEDVVNKRVKSSDPRLSIPDDTMRPPITGETPPAVWKELHDHFKHVHEQEYTQTELARAESEAAGNGREMVGESERLGGISSENGKERQFKIREKVTLGSPLNYRPLETLQLGERPENGRLEPTKALIGIRWDGPPSMDRAMDSTTSKSPEESTQENAVPTIAGPTSEGQEEVTQAQPLLNPAVRPSSSAIGLTMMDGQPMFFFEVHGRVYSHFSLSVILDILNKSIPHWAAGLHTYPKSTQALEAKLAANEELIREQDELIAKKRSSIKSLEEKYDELIQIMPESQKQELILMRDKTRIAMEEEIDHLSKARDQFAKDLKAIKSRIALFNSNIVEMKRVIPDIVRNLTDLESRIP